jgi:hypothetical protein
MKRLGSLCISLLAAAMLMAGTALADDTKPIRHLIYNFSVTISSELAQQSYSGTTNSSGSNGDRGQIVVDVLQVQADTGLVVRIQENARDTRSAAPVMCVTYGNGQMICEAGKKVNDEEYALLRLIGKNFIDPAQIDAKNHWHYGSDSSDLSESNDYTINSNKDGVMAIAFQREVKAHGAQSYTADTQGHLTYSAKMSVPVSENEETMTRFDGAQSYNRVDTSITLSLASDSMQPQTASAH